MFLSRVPLLALILSITCQAQQAPLEKHFDVASIKPNADNDNRIMIRLQPGGGFTATGITVKDLIRQAFDVRDHQISGGPGWISTDRYDIQAKAEGLPDRVHPGEMRPYLQNLLEDRFKLRTHSEEKEMPIYALVVAKGGPKLKATEGAGPGPGIRMRRGEFNATKVSLSVLAQQLSQQLGRTVVDKTSLGGEFDILLQWTPEVGQGGGGAFGGPPPPDAIPAGDSSGPSIFTAVQEQLGLRLESQRGLVPVLVIDSIEKPSEN